MADIALAAGASTKSTAPKIVGLEVMRAAAALMVFAGHLYLRTQGLPRFRILDFALNFGAEAVMAFFVLSGAVISLKDWTSPMSYLGARILRIFPIYYFALALTMAITAFRHETTSLSVWVGNLFFLQTVQGLIVGPPPLNQPLWSLSYEMTYYLLFVFVFLGRWRRFLVKAAFALSLLLGVYMSVYGAGVGVLGHAVQILAFYAVWLLGAGVAAAARSNVKITSGTAIYVFALGLTLSRMPITADYYDYFRLFSFSVGSAALCLLIIQDHFVGTDRSKTIKAPILLRVTISAVVIFSLWLFSNSTFTAKSILSALLICATVSLGGSFPKLPASPLVLRAFTYVGAISYGLYAIHFPILYFVESFTGLPAIARASATVVLSLLLAHFLEMVAQPALRRFLRTQVAFNRKTLLSS